MSLSVSASLLIGFEVCRADFWTLQAVQSQVACPKGHLPSPSSGPFCTQCGGPFASREEQTFVANPHFARLVGSDDPKGAAGRVWDPYADQTGALEEYADPSVFGEFRFLYADPYQDPDTSSKRVILGKTVAECDGILEAGYGDHQTPRALNEQEIVRLFEQCRGLANSLGIASPIKMYLVTDCGY